MAANSYFDDDLSSSQSDPPRYVEIIERFFPDDDDGDMADYQMTPDFKMSPVSKKKSFSIFTPLNAQLFPVCFSKWKVLSFFGWKRSI